MRTPTRSLLLDHSTRIALANSIIGIDRPEVIAPERWRGFLAADLAAIGFDELGAICDLSPTVLDALRWPELRNRGGR